jgi:hypothetical protein
MYKSGGYYAVLVNKRGTKKHLIVYKRWGYLMLGAQPLMVLAFLSASFGQSGAL